MLLPPPRRPFRYRRPAVRTVPDTALQGQSQDQGSSARSHTGFRLNRTQRLTFLRSGLMTVRGMN